jgi:hypothetical protein
MPIAVEPSRKEARDKLVVALRDITDGKIFLEAERARLTRALATIKVSYDGKDVLCAQFGTSVI